MSRSKLYVLIVLFAAVTGCGFPGAEVHPDKEHRRQEMRERAEHIVQEFRGVPYERSPLGEGEGERIYREDAFDCTTFVLTVAARLNAGRKNASEMMKEIHYYPSGEVSFANRLHFSSYRNRVSDSFEDITSEVGGGLTKRARVLLNRDRPGQGRLVPVAWEREVVVEYIPSARVREVVDQLPDVAGAGFVRREYFAKGLGMVHEGLVLDGRYLVHASSEKGKVIRVDFLDYLKRQGYTGVCFYELE